MSDSTKPNHDHLRLAVAMLATLLSSTGVQRWLNESTVVKVTGNTNVAAQGLHEATWAVEEIIKLRLRIEAVEKER